MLMAPYCTMIMAQWGADVIKVEPPSGDVIRQVDRGRRPGMGPIFINLNRGKRSIALDLKAEGAREVLDRLIGWADVLVHNLRPRAEQLLGLRADPVLAVNPRVIHCAFRGFGSRGPYADRPAYDDVIQAASGMASVQGNGGPPEYVRTVAADKAVGLMGASAVLAALLARQSSGVGTAIEVPMFETMAQFMLVEQQGGWVFDPPIGPTGYARTASPHRHPYATEDGYLAVLIYTDQHREAFFQVIGRADLNNDPRFLTVEARSAHIDEFYALVASALRKGTTKEWQAVLESADIPSVPVASIEDLFEDSHLKATGFFQSEHHPSQGPLVLPRLPVDFGGHSPGPGSAPELGEHTVEILREVGLSDEPIECLARRGVLVGVDSEHRRGRAAPQGSR